MNFFGLGVWEIIFILLIVLVVVGPERLPQLARQLGLFVARVQSWLQRSPDARMILQARQELEREIANLRSELVAMQQAQQQLVASARQAVDEPLAAFKSVEEEFARIGSAVAPNGAPLPAPTSAPAGSSAAPPPEAITPGEPVVPPLAAPLLDHPVAPLVPSPAPGAVARGTPPGATERDSTTQAADRESQAPTNSVAGQIDDLTLRLQTLIADLVALQHELQRQGVLDPSWEPAVRNETTRI